VKLFITGANGFIGSNFINVAHSRDVEILAMCRTTRTPTVLLDREPTWIRKSYSDLLPSDFDGCDVLIHLAAHSANVPYDSLEECIVQNVVEPLKMLRTAITAGVSKFLIAGTGFEYGRSAKCFESIPTTASLEPQLSYPASKAAASVVFSALAEESRTKFIVARLFQIFGPGESPNRFWPSLKFAAENGLDFNMSSGMQTKDFLHVEDACAKLLSLCDDFSHDDPYVVRHIGSGNPQTLREFAEHWWQTFNASGKLIFGAVSNRPNEINRYVPLL